MDKKLSALKEIGADVDGALERLNDMEDLYLMVLDKLIDDTCFETFLTYWNKKDYDNALMNIHALKGAAYNLGINELGDMADFIVQDIREARYDSVDKRIPATEACHNKIKQFLIHLLR